MNGLRRVSGTKRAGPSLGRIFPLNMVFQWIITKRMAAGEKQRARIPYKVLSLKQ